MKFIQNKGMTVVELLISSFISVIVISASLGVYIAQHKHMIVQEQVSDMQNSIRASMEELSTKIKMAGYNVPEGLVALTAYNTNPDTIQLTFDSSVLEGVEIDHAMPQPSAELRCSGDISGLNDDDWAYIYDPTTQTGEFFLISHVQYAAGHIQHNTMPLSHTYPIGSQIWKINQYKYFIDKTTDPDHPKLMVQYFGDTPQIYADNITNLQFKYKLTSGVTVDVPPMPEMVKEVNIKLTARTEREDEVQSFGYRTRNLETTVKVRNLAIN